MINKTYPRWLNVTAMVVLIFFIMGLILLVTGPELIGALLLGLSFLGLWIFGDIAKALGK